MSEEVFLGEVQRRFGDWLGALEFVGPRFSYPLGLMHAARYTELRLALISEAAHVIHPIAGQGLNLGIRDVAALAEAIVDAVRLGLEPADPTVLSRYESWRRVDNTTLVAVTDALNRLFSNDLAPLRLARDAGLAAVGKIPPLKRVLHAPCDGRCRRITTIGERRVPLTARNTLHDRRAAQRARFLFIEWTAGVQKLPVLPDEEIAWPLLMPGNDIPVQQIAADSVD